MDDEAAGAPQQEASTRVIYGAGVALLCLTKHKFCAGVKCLYWCTACGYIECLTCMQHGDVCDERGIFVKVLL